MSCYLLADSFMFMFYVKKKKRGGGAMGRYICHEIFFKVSRIHISLKSNISLVGPDTNANVS